MDLFIGFLPFASFIGGMSVIAQFFFDIFVEDQNQWYCGRLLL